MQGVGEAIAQSSVTKILLLNASHDRETGTSAVGPGGMSAVEVVQAVRSTFPTLGSLRVLPA